MIFKNPDSIGIVAIGTLGTQALPNKERNLSPGTRKYLSIELNTRKSV